MGENLVFWDLSNLPASLCLNTALMFGNLPMSELLLTLDIPNVLTKMK